MPNSEKGNNSVKYSQNFMKSLSGHLHHVPKLYAWYHDSRPDIMILKAGGRRAAYNTAKIRMSWERNLLRMMQANSR